MPPASTPIVRIVPISRRRSLMVMRRLMKMETAMMKSMIRAMSAPIAFTAAVTVRTSPTASSIVERVSRIVSRPEVSTS